MTKEEALNKAINIVRYFEAHFAKSKEAREDAANIIEALEQEPCEDEYIKVPKKALKYRTAGMVAYNAEWLKNHFDIERAVICGEQEPCDAVSREAAVNACLNGWNKDYKEIVADIKALPPVTPAEKVGHWTHDGSHWKNRWICSECGYKLIDEQTRYCPNCGAKMEEVEDT